MKISSVECIGSVFILEFVEKNDAKSLHFYHNSLMHFFQSELYTNVKMSYFRQWFENVQMHLCTFAMAHGELMHVCITLDGYTSATVSNMTFLRATARNSVRPSVRLYVRLSRPGTDSSPGETLRVFTLS